MDWKEVQRKAGKVGKTALSWTLFAFLYPLCFFADTDRYVNYKAILNSRLVKLIAGARYWNESFEKPKL
jgi:hypothetical protein